MKQQKLLLEKNMSEFSLKQVEILNLADKKIQQQERKMQLTSNNVTRQVLKAKTDIKIHCATEAVTLENTFKENVEHIEAAVGNSINSKRHKVLMDKKLTVAISELLGTKESLEPTQSNKEQQTNLFLLFTTAMKDFCKQQPSPRTYLNRCDQSGQIPER